MEKVSNECGFFGTANIGKILLRVAPPVMPAQLIRTLYNIVDSFFVGKYSDDALTALSVVYPWQLIAIALAVGLALYFGTVKGWKKFEAQINQSAEPQAEEQTPSGKGEENG